MSIYILGFICGIFFLYFELESRERNSKQKNDDKKMKQRSEKKVRDIKIFVVESHICTRNDAYPEDDNVVRRSV